MAYTLSGLAALGALGAPATSSGLGDQYSVVAYATGTEKRKAEISPHMNAMGLRVMSWPNPGRVGDEWRYTGKVLTTVAMNATAVKAAVITALVRSGADPRTVTVTLLTWPIEGSGGSGGGFTTSEACRARGGVCRDINAQPVRANEEVIRGLCTGPSNIVCVIPRRTSTGGGGGGSSGGGTPSPVSPVVDRGGSFDIGKAVLIGGASLFALALIITLVKKKRASSSMRAAAAATPVRVLPSPRMANRRRRRNGVGQGLPTKVEVLVGSTAIDMPRYSKYQVTDIQPDGHGAKLGLSNLTGRGKARAVLYVRFSKHLAESQFHAKDGWDRGRVTLRVLARMPGWTMGELPLPEFE